MENDNQNNPIPNAGANSPSPQGVNLDKKREELLSVGKIGDGVSGYLNEMGEKINPFSIESSVRPPETKTILKQSIVRTLKTDTEEAINLERMSSASMALAEQKKKQRYPQVEQPADAPKSRKLLLLIISFLFVFVGIGAFNFNYIKEKIAATPEIKPEIITLIISEKNAEFNLDELDGKNLSVSLSKIIKENEIEPKSVENIHITKNIASSEKEKSVKKPLTSKEFLFLITSKTPDALIRSLKPDYMLGVHSLNGNQPFIILKTESYENAFAGMLAWEKNLGKDLESLFSINSGIASHASGTEQIFVNKKEFEDILVKNKDARALRDFDGVIVLIYSIPDKETILIANNAETLTELFDRVIRARTVR